MGQFRKDMTIEQILEIMNVNDGKTVAVHSGSAFLQYKFHQELIGEQKKFQQDFIEMQQKFQKENVFKMGSLVIATWALVCTTIMLVFFVK